MIPENYILERVDVSALSAFAGNPRTHSDGQIDQDRIGPAKLPDARGDLVDLTIRMRARVAGKRRQRGYIQALEGVVLGDHLDLGMGGEG